MKEQREQLIESMLELLVEDMMHTEHLTPLQGVSAIEENLINTFRRIANLEGKSKNFIIEEIEQISKHLQNVAPD